MHTKSFGVTALRLLCWQAFFKIHENNQRRDENVAKFSLLALFATLMYKELYIDQPASTRIPAGRH
jgi:hypothetical protein